MTSGVTTRGLGWKEDPPDTRDLKYGQHAPRVAAPYGPVSLLEYRLRGRDQDGVSACVGFALARALHVSMLHAGNGTAPEPSPLFLYYNARVAEYAGLDPATAPPPEDMGSRPRLAMQALRNLGLCREDDWPFEPSVRNERPLLRCYRNAFDQRAAAYYRIDTDGADRVQDLRSALAQGFPVIFGMKVDQPFLNHTGPEAIEVIWPEEIVGGHMMCALAHDDAGVTFCNSWGPSWGFNDGLGRMTDELFGGPLVGDVYAIKAVQVPA